MRIYRSQVPKISSEVLQTLLKEELVEIDDQNMGEAERDLAAILELYLKRDQQFLEQAKDIVDQRNMTHSDLGRVKREIYERNQHPVGDEALKWLTNQFVECFMASRHVEEVFASDEVLRKKIMEVFKRNLIDESVLDKEVRERMKNLQEGTNAWNIQYQKIMREIRRKHGLS